MKVLTCSTRFPTKHRRAGQQTYFIEKIWAALADQQKVAQFNDTTDFPKTKWLEYYNCQMPKNHTIRAGERWKVGDMASLRVWSGLPYRSKQVEFAQLEIKEVIPVIIRAEGWLNTSISVPTKKTNHELLLPLCEVANNDGLECEDFVSWFSIHPKKQRTIFTGQIISWKEGLYK
jgi:hypothetical protein